MKKLRQKGFTLIELVVTMTVVALVMAALLVMSREGEAQAILIRSAQKLMLDISRQQANAMSAKEVAGEVPCGYGVHFDLQAGSYVLFADRATQPDCSDQNFQMLSEEREEEQISVSKFEAGVIVSGFNNSDIVFNPPEPRVNFYPGAAPAEITLQSSRTGQTIRVVVTLAGQIMIQ